MSHVIYHNTSFKRLDNRSFPSERVAKGVLTKAVNRGDVKREDYTVATYEEWVAADPIVYTYNLQDPDKKPIPIRKSEKGGCTDPGTETYHCM